MPITCICADFEKLRDGGPGKPGPLTKIATFEDISSVVDHVRRMRFVKCLQPEVVEYSKAIATLGLKYGESLQGGTLFAIKPENQAAFLSEKAKIDAETRDLLINKLPPSAYEKIPLSALDLLALEPFIILPEEETSKSQDKK
jgi:hypothetical protein